MKSFLLIACLFLGIGTRLVYAADDAERLSKIRDKFKGELAIMMHDRTSPQNDFDAGSKAMEAAGRFFSKVDLLHLSRTSIEALLGKPNAESPSMPDVMIYSYGNGEMYLIRKFALDKSGSVAKITIIPSQ